MARAVGAPLNASAAAGKSGADIAKAICVTLLTVRCIALVGRQLTLSTNVGLRRQPYHYILSLSSAASARTDLAIANRSILRPGIVVQ